MKGFFSFLLILYFFYILTSAQLIINYEYSKAIEAKRITSELLNAKNYFLDNICEKEINSIDYGSHIIKIKKGERETLGNKIFIYGYKAYIEKPYYVEERIPDQIIECKDADH